MKSKSRPKYYFVFPLSNSPSSFSVPIKSKPDSTVCAPLTPNSTDFVIGYDLPQHTPHEHTLSLFLHLNYSIHFTPCLMLSVSLSLPCTPTSRKTIRRGHASIRVVLCSQIVRKQFVLPFISLVDHPYRAKIKHLSLSFPPMASLLASYPPLPLRAINPCTNPKPLFNSPFLDHLGSTKTSRISVRHQLML